MNTQYGFADSVEPRDARLGSAGLVHDLGNLIQIAASAVNIVSRSRSMPIEHSSPMLQRATLCLEQAGALVRQAIGAARDGRVALEACCVTACLTDVTRLVEAMDEPDLAFEIDVEPDLPRIACDPLGVRRALLNLVCNARDAMAGRGLVAIIARTASRSMEGDMVEISVTDNGVGMSPDTVARAFDPFFTTKSDGLGGVGLPMVERFTREAGGTICVTSEPGCGTTVTMRFQHWPHRSSQRSSQSHRGLRRPNRSKSQRLDRRSTVRSTFENQMLVLGPAAFCLRTEIEEASRPIACCPLAGCPSHKVGR